MLRLIDFHTQKSSLSATIPHLDKQICYAKALMYLRAKYVQTVYLNSELEPVGPIASSRIEQKKNKHTNERTIKVHIGHN